MNPEIKIKLSEVFCDVLEKLAFMFAELPDDSEELEDESGPFLVTSMEFAGPIIGTIRLAVPEDMSEDLVENVLGVEPDDGMGEEAAHDALRELLNVTCGHVLTTLMGETPIFDLSLPVVKRVNRDVWADMQASPATVGMLVDERPALLQFLVTGKA